MSGANDLIVSVSGIRGIIGASLSPEVAAAFAGAFASYTQGGRVVLSRDGRPSGLMIRHAVLAGLLSGGCEVHDLGIVPTPTCGLAVKRLQAAGGVQITASHNPAQWNGLKFFGPTGMVLSAQEGDRLQATWNSGKFHRAGWNELGTEKPCPSAGDWHRDLVLQLLDVARIHARRFRVFLDANGGAGGRLGHGLLEELQCQTTCQGCDNDGLFLHEPEPIAANLKEVCPLIPKHDADVGFVLDPDSDRLALIDETGRYIGEELTLALAVMFRLQNEKGPVVINMSTSRVIEDIAERFGCPCHRAAVGEVNVALKMQEVGAILGGEGNGGVIDPRVGYVRDPFIGMGMILNLLAATGKKLSELVTELPAYVIVKEKYSLDRERLPALFQALEKRWPDSEANREDGLRLSWPDRWVHVRPSNTEPVVRIIAEAPREKTAHELCQDAGKLIASKGKVS